MAKGVVGKIYSKEFGNSVLWSFTLQGDRTFYRLGNKKPAFSEGDSIQFEVETRNGNASAKHVGPWNGEGVQRDVPAASVSAPRTADDFWRRKEQRDVDTQKRIELQSCRNSAIELVKLLQSLEAVKMPTKQADKVSVVEELVKHYTKYFIDENSGKDKGDAPEAIPAVETVTEDNKKENSDDDNWG